MSLNKDNYSEDNAKRPSLNSTNSSINIRINFHFKFYCKNKIDIVDFINRLVKVRIEELESMIKNLRYLFYILKQCCKQTHNNCLKLNTIYQKKFNIQSDSK